MWIKRFFIRNFGHFNNLETDDLSPNFNLVYGKNEAGKTTFMNFIRGLFYGFNKSYLLPGVSQYGGQMDLLRESTQGVEELSVSRYGYDARTRSLEVQDQDGKDQTGFFEGEIEKLAPESFDLVYWLTHREIFELNLKEKDLSSQLYSSAFGLGGKAYKDIIKDLTAENNEIYRPQGQKQAINVLLREIEELEERLKKAQAEQIKHKGYQEEILALDHELEAMARRLAGARRDLDYLERIDGLYEPYQELRQLEAELDLLGQDLDRQAWAGAETEIEYSLSRELEMREALGQVAKLDDSLATITRDREEVLESYGLAWTLADIKAFPLDKGHSQLVKDFERDKASILGQLERGRERLAQEEENIRNKSRRPAQSQKGVLDYIQSFNLSIISFLAFLVSLYFASDLNAGNPGLGRGLSLALLGLFLISLVFAGLSLWREKLSQAEERTAEARLLEEELTRLAGLTQEIEGLELALAKQERTWQEHLQTYRIKGHYQPETVLDLLRDLKPVARAIKEEEDIKEKKQELETRLEDFRKNLQVVFSSIDKAGKYRRQAEDWVFLLAKLRDWQLELSGLETRRAENLNLLRRMSKSQDHYQGLMGDLAARDQVEVKLEISRLEEKIKEIEEEEREKAEKKGRLNEQVERIEGDQEVLTLNLALDQARDRLAALAENWMVNTSIIWLLNQAKADYQDKYQPEIIKLASQIFRDFTQGDFVQLSLDFEEDIIRVRRADGDWLELEALSQGTREQVYISMRLAFVREMNKSSLALPLFVDDVLVNADQGRMRAGLELLMKWSREQQVIFFTCHQHVYEAYQELVSQLEEAGEKIEGKVFHLERDSFREEERV